MTAAEPIQFAGSMLTEYRHVCVFFSSPKEEYETLLPFVRDGFDREKRAYHALRSEYRQRHLERLRDARLDVAAAEEGRHLEVATADQNYLRGGRLDRDAMLLQVVLKSDTALGFPRTRLVAHVAEAVMKSGRSNVEERIKYEARPNEALRNHDDPAICTYDLIRGAIATDVLRTHLGAIVGGLLYQNPFFVPANEFLHRYQQREGAAL